MKRILAQARKELTQIRRDRLALVLALVLPVILLALFGFAISLTVTDLPIIVQDLDQSPTSRQYIDVFRESLTFHVVAAPVEESPMRSIENGTARAAIIIPEHFERDVLRGTGADVQMLVDAGDANTANLIRGASAALSQAFNRDLAAASGHGPPINVETRLWYNPGRKSTDFMGPGMLAVGLALFAPLLAALSMSREGEQKTILQVYVSSISAHEYLLGKILAFWIIGLCQWVLAVIFSYLLFGLWFVGDPTPFLVGTVIYLFCNVTFGVMIGAGIPNQAAAIQAVQLGSFMLSFLLSGLIFPVANIPASIRWISAIVPARYYIEMSRDAFVKGGGWSAVWYAPIVLTVIGAFLYLRAWIVMRKMQVDA
ncbi:MAG TPA: ABC transporter permease [Blastocatellia bacterium]|nr:ABC transporter permease [Blastocatellia bacterium]